MTYARHLMSVFLGRFLTEEEHVDHINDDCTDDRIENLQILTPSQNSLKMLYRRGRVMAVIICPTCGFLFSCEIGNTSLANCYKGRISACCARCRDTFWMNHLTNPALQWIYEMQIPLTVREFYDGRVILDWVNPLWIIDDRVQFPRIPDIEFGIFLSQRIETIKQHLDRGLSKGAIGKLLNIHNVQRFCRTVGL